MQLHRGILLVAVIANLAFGARAARADHVILQDGRIFINVRVSDFSSTETTPARIVTANDSFGYNFSSNTIYSLRGPSMVEYIQAHMTTSTRLNRNNVRQFLLDQGWHNLGMVTRTVAPMPTREPEIIVTPIPRATPRPVPTANPNLPLAERVQEQLNMFVSQQKAEAARLDNQVAAKSLSDTEAREGRIQLLERQRAVLKQYFPKGDVFVDRADQMLLDEVTKVRKNGKYFHETSFP